MSQVGPLDLVGVGFGPSNPGQSAAEALDHVQAGPLAIDRDYRLVTVPALQAGIYVQGATEHTHGLSSTLLSNIAVRSGESIAAHATARV